MFGSQRGNYLLEKLATAARQELGRETVGYGS
jgi:hypothetical protein